MTSLSRLLHRSSAAYVFLGLLSLLFFIVALDAIRQIGIAHADADHVAVVAASPPVVQAVQAVEPVPAPMSTGAIAFFVAITALAALSAIGHVIAPRTKTTIDDRALAKIDELLILMRGSSPPVVTTTDAAGTTTTVRLKESGRVHLGVVAFFTLIAMLTLPLLGCATLSNAPSAAKDAVIDCTKADVAAIGVLVGELGADAVTTALGTGKADWAKLEADAIAQGKVIGGCALAQFVAALSKSAPAAATQQSLVAQASPADDGRAALDRFRTKVGGGRWSTESP